MAAHVKVVPCHSFHSYVYWVTQISQGLNKKRDTNSAHYCDIIVNTLSLSLCLCEHHYFLYSLLNSLQNLWMWEWENNKIERTLIQKLDVVSFESLIIKEVRFLKASLLVMSKLECRQ